MFTPIIDPLVIVIVLVIIKIIFNNVKFILSNMKVDNRYIAIRRSAIINPFAPICFPTYIDTIKNVKRVKDSNIVVIIFSFSILDERKVINSDSIKLIKASNNIDEIVIFNIFIICSPYGGV